MQNEQVAVEQIDHGGYEDAVTFALDAHDDTLQTYEFLQAWRNGNLDEWPEYYEWLSKRTRALEASQPQEAVAWAARDWLRAITAQELALIPNEGRDKARRDRCRLLYPIPLYATPPIQAVPEKSK